MNLCSRCSQPSLPNRIICKYHHHLDTRRRYNREEAGKCTHCGKYAALLNQTKCKRCKQAARIYSKQRRVFLRAFNLCVRCKSPTRTHQECTSCREKRRLELSHLKKNGLCTRCKKKTESKHIECESCRKKRNLWHQTRKRDGNRELARP